MRLTNHLYQVCGRNWGSHQNVYAVDTGGGVVLVDSGLDRRDRSIIENNLEYWGLARKPIAAVLLTHEHYEHIGNAPYYQSRGAILYAHRAAANNILISGEYVMDYAFPECRPCASFTVDRVFGQESIIRFEDVLFNVYDAPGHSKGSVLLESVIDGNVVVFSGDTILVTDTCHKASFGCTAGIDYDETEYLETLRRFSEREADILLPGHGEICMREASRMFVGAYLRSRLDFKRNHHRDYLNLGGGFYAD